MSDNQSNSEVTVRVVPIAEAAHILGVSERTVWRRIAKGALSTFDMNGKTCVQVRVSDTNPDTSHQAVTASDDARQTELFDTVSALRDRVETALRDIITRQADEIAFLRREVDSKQATINTLMPMLPAPKTQAKNKTTTWLLVVIAAGVLGAGSFLLWFWLYS